MQTIWHHLGYALRQLRRSPGFAVTVVLTLALGVGANAVVFSVLNALILRPLPLPDAQRLMFFNRTGASTGSSTQVSPAQSWPDYRDMRDRNHTFSGIAAYRFLPVGVQRGDSASKSWVYEASGNYFDVLGVQPQLGRFFHASDEHGPNGSPYAVLSDSFWHGRFGADPTIVGKTIQLNKHPFTVLGVAPPGFVGTELFISPDLWSPIMNAGQLESYTSFEARGNRGIWWTGRLKPGVTVAQAQADVNAIARQMTAENPENDDGLQFRLSRPGLIGEYFGKGVKAFLSGVMTLAALVLFAACANLASLFSARAADRAREFGVRLALGATRRVLARQLITEALLVSLLGGGAGLAAAVGLLRLLSGWRPMSGFPAQLTLHPDLRVWFFALVLSLGSGLFFGLVPVRQVWRGDAYAVLKSGSAGSLDGSEWMRLRLRDVLLVAQIVLCSVLVTASLVAVRGLAHSLHTAYGFQPEGVLLASFDLRMSGHTDTSARQVQRRALEAVRALPGVSAAGFANTLPLNVDSSDTSVFRDGTTDFRASNEATDASYYDVSPGYFGAAGTRLVAGRDFSWHDDAQAPQVAIVNETFVRQVFGDSTGTADVIGRYFFNNGRRQVIGVVENGKYEALTEIPKAAFFLPIGQQGNAQTVMVVRGRSDAAALAGPIRMALMAMDPSMPLTITTWNQALGMALFPSVAATAALGVMGGLAAMLAVTGIFGMASYSVSKRMREFGLRVALGAGRAQVLRAALGKPARLLVFGSACGLLLGALSSRLLAHIVYQASSQDPLVLGGVVVSMALLALLATWLPARRALHADPAQLLRED